MYNLQFIHKGFIFLGPCTLGSLAPLIWRAQHLLCLQRLPWTLLNWTGILKPPYSPQKSILGLPSSSLDISTSSLECTCNVYPITEYKELMFNELQNFAEARNNILNVAKSLKTLSQGKKNKSTRRKRNPEQGNRKLSREPSKAEWEMLRLVYFTQMNCLLGLYTPGPRTCGLFLVALWHFGYCFLSLQTLKFIKQQLLLCNWVNITLRACAKLWSRSPVTVVWL